MGLNGKSKSVPYCLGRLFAVLEKIQKDDARTGKINVTVKDKYFGSAMVTPAVVFPTLLKLSIHHLKNAKNGNYYEGLKGEILTQMEAEALPKRLSLEEQGEFALGYYQQEKDFYVSKKDKNQGQGKENNEICEEQKGGNENV